MAARSRMSTSAKVITALIYALAVALLVAVIYMNLKPSSFHSEPFSTNSGSDEITTELPYNADGTDKYADVEPIYTVNEVTIEKDANGIWSAYYQGKKTTAYTGVARNEHGWFFVRDGEVDFNYNGIAGNENGNWYVKKGKVDFKYTGTFTVNNKSYKVVEGQVID